MPASSKKAKANHHAGYGGVPGEPSGKHRYFFGATMHTAGKRGDARRRRRHGRSNNPSLALGQNGGRGR